MACNGKRQLESGSESLLNKFEFFESALVWVQYPVENAASSCLKHCNRSVVIELAWLKERRKKEEDRRFGRLATYRCSTPAMVSGNANTLVAHENTREWLVWLTKVYDCIYSRVLNVWFYTRDMWTPFFPHAIPTYRVLPYSMITKYSLKNEITECLLNIHSLFAWLSVTFWAMYVSMNV